MSSGHYTAFAQRCSKWLHFDDSTVSEVDESEVKYEAAAKVYMLFYVRR